MVEEPVVFVLTIGGVWYGLRTLNLPDAAHAWIGNIVQFLIVLAAAWMLTRVLDAIYREYLVPLADKSENELDDQLTSFSVWPISLPIM